MGAKLDFVVEMHGLAADDSVYLCGSDDALGAWNKAKSLLLTRIARTQLLVRCGDARLRCRLDRLSSTSIWSRAMIQTHGDGSQVRIGRSTLLTKEVL